MLKLKLFNHQTGEFQETVLDPNRQQSEVLIGRAASCDLVLDGADVSRVHGQIKFQQGDYCYSDLGSANGSRINNQAVQVHQSYPLKVDDLIRIGDFVLMVEAIEITAASGEASIWRKLSGERPIWAKGDLTVRCIRVTDETADVKTFTFVADPPVLFHYQPGQFVTLDLEINGESVLRSYSISSSPSRPHTLEITVKRVASSPDAPDAPPGLVSNWLHDQIKVGSRVKLSGPLGKFTCYPNPAKKLLLISAGSGITPMMSMSRWIADTGVDTDVIFFHCARTPRDIIFRQELELMAARLPSFHPVISVTRSEPGQPWFGFSGRLTDTMLHSIAPDFQDRTVYVCGPNGFMQNVKTLLESLHFPMSNYHEESFGSPKKAKPISPPPSSSFGEAHEPPPSLSSSPSSALSPSTKPAVFFAQSNQEVIDESAESILDLAEQAGIKIRSNCRQGVCGACKKRKLEGVVKYESEPDGLDREEQEAGYILTCVAAPVGRVVVEA
ncbi:MAG: FHA domain-containing protein [Leptolyngbya sp. IPPAS B-1204]|nr:FHA domain-containing protein [Elainella sp. C42_A2020_010]RNJ70249.1 MAG: FHA domain-containing protein [Leptolyngbya sp. IPPAS B-1204]